MHAIEEKNLGDFDQLTAQSQLANQRPIGTGISSYELRLRKCLPSGDAKDGDEGLMANDHGSKTLVRIHFLNFSTPWIGARPCALPINLLPKCEDKHNIRLLLKHLHAPFYERWGMEIIVGGPFEEFSASLVEDEVVVSRCPKIGRLAVVLYARVLLRVTSANLFCAVSRCVVGDDEFKIAIGLGQQGIEALLQVVFAIVDWKPDA